MTALLIFVDVITSYSIHYTKLYERKRCCPLLKTVGSRPSRSFTISLGPEKGMRQEAQSLSRLPTAIPGRKALSVDVFSGAVVKKFFDDGVDQVDMDYSIASTVSVVDENSNGFVDVITSYSIHYTKLYE